MGPKNLPSSCGLPNCWSKEMELRLGYFEAQDEMQDLRDMVRALKREFPALADYVITTENLLRWIEWLDRQEAPRGDSFRAGLAAGQAMVQGSLNAKGIELDPMDLDIYRNFDAATPSGSQANMGVRLVDSDSGIDDVRATAGGLESMINVNNSTTSSNIAPSVVYHTARRTLGYAIPSTPTTPSPGGASGYQYHRSGSRARRQSTMTDQDVQHIRHLGIASSRSRSVSPMTQPMTSSTTSGSLNIPGTTASSPYPSTLDTPAAFAHLPRTTSHNHKESPRRTSSLQDHTAAAPTRMTSSGSAVSTPSRSNAITTPGHSSPSSGSGLRERRQLRELNVGIAVPNYMIQALPEIGGKENEQSPTTPAATSTTSLSLKERMMSRLGTK